MASTGGVACQFDDEEYDPNDTLARTKTDELLKQFQTEPLATQRTEPSQPLNSDIPESDSADQPKKKITREKSLELERRRDRTIA